jgi:hypothetical protein
MTEQTNVMYAIYIYDYNPDIWKQNYETFTDRLTAVSRAVELAGMGVDVDVWSIDDDERILSCTNGVCVGNVMGYSND